MLALALALAPTKFVAGPLAIVVDLVTSGGVLDFYTYLVLAQGKLTSLLGCGEVLFTQNGHNYTEHLFRMRASVQHWLYSTLIYASGLFVGVDQAQPLHDPDAQLPRENPGFPMPQQLADLTLAVVENLVPVVAPVLIPIFGALVLATLSNQASIPSSACCNGIHLYVPSRKPAYELCTNDTRNLQWRSTPSVHHCQD